MMYNSKYILLVLSLAYNFTHGEYEIGSYLAIKHSKLKSTYIFIYVGRMMWKFVWIMHASMCLKFVCTLKFTYSRVQTKVSLLILIFLCTWAKMCVIVIMEWHYSYHLRISGSVKWRFAQQFEISCIDIYNVVPVTYLH